MQHEDEPCRPASLWRRLLADWLSEEDQVAEVAAEVSEKISDECPRTGDEMAA
jgi:hypothetical protein